MQPNATLLTFLVGCSIVAGYWLLVVGCQLPLSTEAHRSLDAGDRRSDATRVPKHVASAVLRTPALSKTYSCSLRRCYKMRHFWTFSPFLAKYCSGLTSKPAFSTPPLRMKPVRLLSHFVAKVVWVTH